MSPPPPIPTGPPARLPAATSRRAAHLRIGASAWHVRVGGWWQASTACVCRVFTGRSRRSREPTSSSSVAAARSAEIPARGSRCARPPPRVLAQCTHAHAHAHAHVHVHVHAQSPAPSPPNRESCARRRQAHGWSKDTRLPYSASTYASGVSHADFCLVVQVRRSGGGGLG